MQRGRYLGSEHPDFGLEGSARSVVQFEGVLPEATSCVVYAPIDLDGQVGIHARSEAIVTQWRILINSGLTQFVAVGGILNKWTPSRKSGGIS